MKSDKKWRAAAVLLALALWQILSMLVGREMLLASPLKVLERMMTIWREPGFWTTVGSSFLRFTAGYVLALMIGVLLGTMAGRFFIVEHLLWPYVLLIKTVPVASFIILCLLWFNFSQMTVLISFMIAFPVIYSNVLQGIRSTDPGMKEMARLFKVPWNRQLVYIYLPSVKPYLLSASSVAIGMAWKAGVAAEVIGIADGSIGGMLYQAKIYFQNADLLCWTILIVLLSILSEKLFAVLLRLLFKGGRRA